MRSLKIRWIAVVAVTGFLWCVLVPQPAVAAQSKTRGVNKAQMQDFRAFLQSHPDIRKGLRGNPALAKDPNFLSGHPELKDYFDQHPGVQQRLANRKTGKHAGSKALTR